MDEFKNEASKVEGIKQSLKELSEEELQAVIEAAQALIGEREKERKQAALDEIKKIAKEHGLSVSLTDQKRRGRKPKGSK